MAPTLVATPETSFEELAGALEGLGWFLESEPQEAPLIPGEPEWAVFTHRTAAAELQYSFNPVVALRVLQFHGADGLAQWSAASQAIPLLDAPALRRLLGSTAPKELLLGLLAAGELRERSVLGQIAALRSHPDARIARTAEQVHGQLLPPDVTQAVKHIAAEKEKHPDRSALYAHLPDVEQRRQILRWFIRDHSGSNPNIDQVLRTALADPDGEVRVTAVLAAARLGAREVLPALREARMPTSSRDGADDRDRLFYPRLQEVVAALLAGRLPPEGSPKRARLEPLLLRAITREPEVHDDPTLLVHALSTPVDPGSPPATLPEALMEDAEHAGAYRLRRSGLETRWVPPVEHWLGEGANIRRVRSPGFFVARMPVSRAASAWALAPTQGPIGTASKDDAAPKPCTWDEAAKLCEALARIEGAALRLPGSDEWEMAVRGPDGRRFPWGNSVPAEWASLRSPWGVERAVGSLEEWTRDTDAAGGRVLRGGRESPACTHRRVVPAEDAKVTAAVRWILLAEP